ncbi:MAG: GHKL domain-containing protein, partial [Lachnospiraceae bacterium]|nr:GHKL domain-containing protein [Lachnospiraceae bacterium]
NACNEADSDKKRFIKLNVCTSLEKGQFIIRTINTNPVKDLKKNEDLSHGYGLVNIKEHLDKVFGIMDLKENEKEFEVCVIIPLMQIENKASNS